jgi:two-component system C4-dicarboxylate transport response regulator DctD
MTATNIILVDDEKAVRDSTAQSLMLAGFEVETFSNAPSALAKITPECRGWMAWNSSNAS